MGRELRRTLGQAKAHSHTSTAGATQLAPVVSQYVSTRAHSVPAPSPLGSSTSETNEASTSTLIPSLAASISHLSLIPQWDPPTAYFDPFAPAATIRDDIVIPYRPGRRIPPNPLPLSRASALLAPRPVRISDTIRSRTNARPYTSSTAPTQHAMEVQMPFSLPVPPSILSDKFDASTFTSGNNTSWPFDFLWSQQPAEPELSLVPQQPPSPGPGTVRTRETAEHTVLSPSAAAPQQSSSPSQALLTHYVASFPSHHTEHALPNPTDAGEVSTYSSSLEFRIGASGLAKVRPPPTPPRTSPSGRERPPPTRTFQLSNIAPPTDMQSEQVGEDAYFTRPDAMCIADGVGGWARSGRGGANAARWSRLLTHFIREEVDLWWKGDSIYTERAGGRKAKKTWSEAWRDGKTKEDDTLGLEEGMKRRKLDAVEIMQRGFEKCLSCVMSEVS
jgi:hypothetical protein